MNFTCASRAGGGASRLRRQSNFKVKLLQTGENVRYAKVRQCLFLRRISRFLAEVDFNGRTGRVHVKNTGRCAELLLPGVPAWLNEAGNTRRATQFDLVAVEKNGRLINMDAGAPNAVFREFLQGGSYLDGITRIRAEARYGASRLDFYVEAGERRIFIEVKGVTLEEDGAAMFPDAPTQRGVKHLNELAHCIRDGYEARVVFVVQMRGARYFAPHRKMHPAFADALARARDAGVGIEAYDCDVAPDSLVLGRAIGVRL
jgi:sugar fermentation stimulation protein A